MKVFLSYAYGPFDGPIAARLRAVAAAYDISILLPDRTSSGSKPSADTLQKIKQSDAVIALITKLAPLAARQVVDNELQRAITLAKPIIPLVEEPLAVASVPPNQIVYFNRLNPAAHEGDLLRVLAQIQEKQRKNSDLAVVGWIAAIALGLLVLNELTAEKK